MGVGFFICTERSDGGAGGRFRGEERLCGSGSAGGSAIGRSVILRTMCHIDEIRVYKGMKIFRFNLLTF